MITNNRSLQNWLAYIESFHPDEIELGLDRIRTIASKLDLLKFCGKVIIIAGTNGKGSCVAGLESFALRSDLSVGCYTSPHLIRFNERIRVNGKDISDERLVAAFKVIEKARDDIAVTFFEFTTLVAFLIFREASLDLIVLEVGLGGRLDAVNIVKPDATIITTIDYDHLSWLGHSLKNIAFEKSGICRKKIKNFVGDLKSYNLILEVRSELVADLMLIENEDSENDHIINISKWLSDKEINPYRLLFQNFMLASQVFESLFSQEYSSINLPNVISNIDIKGRFQQISSAPLVIVDVAHNAQAATNLRYQIRNLPCKGGRYAICGLMADKAISQFLKIMDEVIDHWYFVDLPIERAAYGEDLRGLYSQMFPDTPVNVETDVQKAYKNIYDRLSKADQVFVFGSFITVAEMLQCIE